MAEAPFPDPKDPREKHLQEINSTMLAIEAAHDRAVRARKQLVELPRKLEAWLLHVTLDLF